MSIAANIAFLKAKLPDTVKLVAVSKFHPAEDILEAYEAGQRIFGENRAQELIAKQKVLPEDIEWHFLGPLQTNKVKDIVPFADTIQSVDSLKLLQEIENQAAKQARIIHVLLEIHIAKEVSKHGFTPEECKAIWTEKKISDYRHIRFSGLMGMATFTEDKSQIADEFLSLRQLFDELKVSVFKNDEYFRELSMGMTGDYEIALAQGSTMVRVGSFIFGQRT
jgi:pyridoxal phosphate enzyme (YggS family)